MKTQIPNDSLHRRQSLTCIQTFEAKIDADENTKFTILCTAVESKLTMIQISKEVDLQHLAYIMIQHNMI